MSSRDREWRPAADHDSDSTGARSAFEECAGRIDEFGRMAHRGKITSREHGLKVFNALSDYFENDRPDDDIDLLIDYARASIAQGAVDPLSGDRGQLDLFDRSVRALLVFPVAQAELRTQLDRTGGSPDASDPLGMRDLRALCAHGRRDRFRIYMYRANALETLRFAAELGAVEALVDSVHPSHHFEGQIGAPDYFHGEPRQAAFNHLAHLASGDDTTAESALEALISLTRFLTTAGPAVVRLPSHLLTSGQRETLFRDLEWWEDLLVKDPIQLPVEEADRIPDAIRSVLWLANDASHLS